MSHNREGIPIGFPLNVQGGAQPWQQEFDPALSAPVNIIPLSGTTTIQLPRGSYIEVTGNFSSGWVIQPNGAGAGNVPLAVSACFPAPRDGNLIVSAAGTGTPILIIWPQSIGREIARGRGFAPPGTSTASAGGAKYAGGHAQPQRVALATGVPVLYTESDADVMKIIVKAKNSNAAVAYVSDDVASAGQAAERFELGQGDWLEITRAEGGALTFAYDGTTGDHLFLWKYRST